MERLMRFVVLFLVVLVFSLQQMPRAGAQPNPDPAGKSSSKGGPKKQLATIVFAGLGGAVLGLSTLSFYGRPQEKLANIPIGAAFGMIIGTIYVTYQTATNPEILRSGQIEPMQPLEVAQMNRFSSEPATPGLTLSWQF